MSTHFNNLDRDSVIQTVCAKIKHDLRTTMVVADETIKPRLKACLTQLEILERLTHVNDEISAIEVELEVSHFTSILKGVAEQKKWTVGKTDVEGTQRLKLRSGSVRDGENALLVLVVEIAKFFDFISIHHPEWWVGSSISYSLKKETNRIKFTLLLTAKFPLVGNTSGWEPWIFLISNSARQISAEPSLEITADKVSISVDFPAVLA